MNRFRTTILLSVILAVSFTSCTRKTGPAKACFKFSKESCSAGDTLYLLNCSENYQKFMWFYPMGATVDSVSRHLMIVAPSAGIYPVGLRVGDYPFTDTVGIVKTFTVNP